MVEAAFAAAVVALAVIEAVAGLGAPLTPVVVCLTLVLAAAAAWRIAASFAVRRGTRVWPVVLAVAWSSSVWLRLAFLAWCRPVYDWDGLYYHLPALQGWVQAGRVAWLDDLPDLPWANGYPGGMEVLSFVVHRLTGSSAFVDGSNLLLWPLGALGLVVLAGRLGVRGPWRWLPVALGAGVPTLVVQSCTCYTDVGFAAAVTAALAAALLYVFADDLGRATRVVVLGAALGLMLATKGTGAPFAAIIGLIAVGAASARARWRLAVAGVAVVAIALVVGGSWYARNYRHTGNPLFPIVLRLGPWELAPGWNPADLVDPNLPPWLADVPPVLRPWRCWVEPGTPVAHTDPTAGLGWLWIAGGVPAALWVIGRRPGAPALLLVATGTVLLLVHPAPWWSRQTLWLHAIGLPCLALALGSLPRAPAIGLTLAFALTAIWEGESALAGEWSRGWTGDAYVSTWDDHFPSVPTAPGLDRAVAAPVIARSEWSRAGTLLGGILCLPLEARRIHYVTATADSAEVARLRDAGVTWVLWDRVGAGEPPAALIAAASERFRHAPEPGLDLEALHLGRH
jgi:hypothetical protein